MWAERLEALQCDSLASIVDGVLARWFTKNFRERRKAELRGWRNMLLRTPPRAMLPLAQRFAMRISVPILVRSQ